jgi:hypothetical protein
VACARSCAAMALELKNEGALWPASIEREGDKVFGVRSEHLSLVRTNARDTRRSDVPSHSNFLKASTIRVHRERPVAWANHMIQFTPWL